MVDHHLNRLIHDLNRMKLIEMNKIHYREGEDCVWIASDKNGNVAAFVTAGEAPILNRAVNDDILNFYEIESSIFDLPPISDCEMLLPMKNSSDFVEMARRGFFVYDWPDAGRIRGECSRTYELASLPTNPRLVAELPNSLQMLAKNSALGGISFLEKIAIDPISEFY